MKKIVSNIYHKFFKYKFDDSYVSVDFNALFNLENSETEKYRLKLFNKFNLKKVSRILDYGCGYGINLKVLQDINPKFILNGMDISKKDLRMLEILNNNLFKININILDHNKLKNFENKFDLVFTDAVLIYVNPSTIKDHVKNLINSSKKYLLFHELTYEFNKSKISHLNIHDFRFLIKSINPKLKISFYKSLKPGYPWSSHGTRILISKK
jgi:SAM-dependent methyltransferase